MSFARRGGYAAILGCLGGAVSLAAQTSKQDLLATASIVSLRSAALGGERQVFVTLPETYADTSERFPVLILLDAQDRPQFRSAISTIRFLADRKLIPPMILVGVPFGATRDHDLSPVAHTATAKQRFPTAGGADATRRFVVDELVPWIAARYRTTSLRILAGHSLGGLFAIGTAVARPEAFRIVVAMSPSLWWDDEAVSRELGAALVQDTGRARTLFLSSGGLEPHIDVPAGRFAAALEQAAPRGLAFAYRRYPDDDHSLTSASSLPDALRFAFRPLRVPVDSVMTALQAQGVADPIVITAALDSLRARYATAAASLGAPNRFPEAALNLIGYYAMIHGQSALAVRLLRENTERYPTSGNAYDSLSEALVAVGDTVGGLSAARKTISLVPRADDPARLAALARLRTVGASHSKS